MSLLTNVVYKTEIEEQESAENRTSTFAKSNLFMIKSQERTFRITSESNLNKLFEDL